MHFKNLLGSLAVLTNVQSTFGAPFIDPVTVPAASCNNPPIRQEWRQLSNPQKKAYIDAVLCLTTQPAITNLPGALNHFDDHQAVHSAQTPSIHWVGHFILWHRYFVATFEKALRETCAYTGAQPYWDWSLDADPTDPSSTAPFSTAIFDPATGFGGNGLFVAPTPEQNPLNITGGTGGGCVADGPFAAPAFYVNIPTRDCLRRDFIPWIMNSFADPALVAHVLAQPDYTSFARAVEGTPSFAATNIHGSGHFGVGGVLGQLGNAANSPADPLFYLHHGNLDHVLWKWQQQDLACRLNEVGGPVMPFDYAGVNVTLDFTVDMGPLAGSATLKDLLDTEGDTLCYTYDE
ncbi:Di-copper centre-containing protein [Karstenula rhodostoma CBS 690.94]|uniref:Di-copper centre-containing protein n=1 Tax=Karstenula rhodostoma CBS 690.94 TaxID=1392251 RepID=A0A9P4P412_9PLEO|nr:Di-copper centre-containing protein [Karstenula rhodostoma CBS 690.94]